MDSVIKLRQIEKVYGKVIKNKVLHGIDLDIHKGSFTSIIGASGSGKSTLLNIVGTLDQPTNGQVTINNRRTDELNKKELAEVRNEEIGFIFQFHYLLPEFTAIENVLMPYQIQFGKIDDEAYQRAEMLLDLVELTEVKDNLSTNMSGGQQQRTAIARALMNNPSIILADEPTGNLDSEATDLVYDILRKINKEFETTFVIITHDQRIAEKADRIIEIKDGRDRKSVV